jgi:sialate O-acetylesterase
MVPSGPLYKSHKVEDGTIRLTFDNVGKGLMVGEKAGIEPTQEVPGGELKRFAIAGADTKWHWAEATIDGETVVVKCAEVPEPVAVRYAFTMNPTGANLYNKEGIPASPFRTDDW